MNDELTSLLSRQLHEQVDDWHAAPLSLEGVQGKARSIRRTRRVVATSAVAAVFAIVAPAALLLGDGPGGRADREIPPATSTPDGDRTTTGEGSGLDVAYLEGTTLVRPDGNREQLPRRYDGAVVWGDTVLGIGRDRQTGEVFLERLADDGTVEDTVALTAGIARNADGTAIAYVTADGELVVEWDGGSSTLASEVTGRPVSLTGEPGCPDPGCVVHVEDGTSTVAMSSDGGVADVPGSPVAVHDAAEDGRVAVLTEVDDFEPGSCSQVRTPGSETPVFETCDHTPQQFSPGGGEFLSAHEAYLDGIGPGLAAILDAETGEELARFEPGSHVWGIAWEDAEHLLVVGYDSDGWSVTRLGADGSTERVLGPNDATDEMRPAYVLAGGI